MPQGIRFLNETKLGKSAADNLRRGCTCSKHGLSLADALAPGDLEQWIRKTMLSGCAAYGTLDFGAAGYLSMVFILEARWCLQG